MTEEQVIEIIQAMEAQTNRVVDQTNRVIETIRWTNVGLFLILVFLLAIGFALRH